MTIHGSLLVPGLLLLLLPADRLLAPTVELRSFECFRTLSDSPRHRPWWWVPALWLDPLRGFAGTLLLQHAFALAADDRMLGRNPVYWTMVALLGGAVLLQVFTRRERGVVLAPLGFVVGVVTALTPWPVAAIGCVMATVGLFAFRQFHAFFSVGCVTVAFLGFVLDADVAWIAPAIGALGLPVLFCFFSGTTMELPTCGEATPGTRPGFSR